MNCRLTVALFTLVIGLAAAAGTNAAPLAPTKDAFGYQFLPTTPFSGADPLDMYLPAGQTSTNHSTESALMFDVASLGLTAADVTSATLSLFVVSTEVTGFGNSPTGANPVTVNLSALGPGSWEEATATRNLIPAAVGGPYDSQVVNAIGVVVNFDVTQLVKDWLDGAVTNNGILLEGAAPVGAPGNWFIPTFSSKEGVSAPTLTIVPEPGSVVLAACAIPALVWLGRRRQRGRK